MPNTFTSMANTFTLILALATLLTGIIWCIERFIWAPARQKKNVAISTETASDVIQQPCWIETAVSIFPVLLIVFCVRSFVYEPYQIPSGSMMPTLLIGDFILVEKYAYGIKDPITQTTLIPTGHPKRGDVVVFKYPLDKKVDFIKRVIGLPGDHVRYDPVRKEVHVQPSCQPDTDCGHQVMTYSTAQPSNFVQTFVFNRDKNTSTAFLQIPLQQSVPDNGIRQNERIETAGSVSHPILILPGTADQMRSYYRQQGQPIGSWVVPHGEYFMMGDNRDNSADSRFWGFVPERNLVGKATAIWMSFEKQENEWPTGVRLSRIGSID